MNKAAILIILTFAVVQTSATEVTTCETGAVDSTSVTVSNCAKGPCTMTRGGKISGSLRFTPTTDISSLTVNAKITILLLPVTIPGVDGISICGKIVKASDNSPAPCPLRAGVEYIYRDTLPVSITFAHVITTVRLALMSGSTTIKCFRIGVSLL